MRPANWHPLRAPSGATGAADQLASTADVNCRIPPTTQIGIRCARQVARAAARTRAPWNRVVGLGGETNVPCARRFPMAVETRPTTRQGSETVFVDRFCDGIIGPSSRDARPGARRRPHRRQHRARLLGADDHAGHQGRPRGDAAGRRRRRRGRRRGRHLDPRHLGDLARDVVRQRPHDRGPLQRRSLLRQGVRVVRRRRTRPPSSRASAPTACAAPTAARPPRRSRSRTATRSRSTTSGGSA